MYNLYLKVCEVIKVLKQFWKQTLSTEVDELLLCPKVFLSLIYKYT